jgi:hypothetical protein
MNRNIELIIDGRRADTFRDTAITLNFNSSLLSDIGQLKSDISQTIRLPRTIGNDIIFDLALLPSYESDKTYRYMSCSCYIDGITIFDNGQCHLLDSSEEGYEIAVTWGTMHALGSWVTAKRKLRELTAYTTDSIPWNSKAGVTYAGGGTSRIEADDDKTRYAMYYANYNVGVNLASVGRDKQNISPCVTLLEVWERIRRENALQMVLDDNIRDDMERNVIVLTKNNNTSLQTLEQSLILQAKSPAIKDDHYLGYTKKLFLDFANVDFFDTATSSFVQKGYNQVRLTLSDIYLSMYYQQTGEGAADFANETYYLVLKYGNTIVRKPSQRVNNNTIKFGGGVYEINQFVGEDHEGEIVMEIYVELHQWNNLPDPVWEYPNRKYITGSYGGWANYSLKDSLRFITLYDDITSLNAPTTYQYQNNSNDYPLASFALVPNLPDITQIDFVNMICKLYGLFPIADGQSVRFVRFDVLQDNIASGNTEDWSSKHISASDTPIGIAFDLDGYARHNYLKYKEDKTDPTDYKGDITSENDVISLERTFYEFPLAASKGNLISQFYLNEAGEVQKNDSEYRLMRMYSDSTLSFDESLKPQQIVNRHYQSLQSVARRPIVIEDEFLLDELDLRSLDYTKPVYLAKYGRYYAVISIQWSSDKKASKAKLLQL